MSTIKALIRPGIAFAALAVALLVMGGVALPLIGAPEPQSQGLSFSVGLGDPRTSTGVHPADILGIGAIPLISCDKLGLLCADPISGVQDDLISLSYGWDFVYIGFPPIQFSVAPGSTGATGTAVRNEANCSQPEAHADVFETDMDTQNGQDLDGNGVACSSNSGYGLILTETSVPSDNVDAIDRDPCLFVDPNCDGTPEEPIFFSLAANSPSLAMIGASPADILVSGIEYAPLVWARGTTDLGLDARDVIDAICIREDGDGKFGDGDRVLFSLAPGSPTLTRVSASPADLLRPSPSIKAIAAGKFGLMSTDDLDAVMCSSDLRFLDIFLPVVKRH